jgi:hypothetical protein
MTPGLSDPRCAALWESFADLVVHGVGTFHHWRPDDGLGFAAGMPAHQHSMPTLTVCLSGRVRVIGRQVVNLGRLPPVPAVLRPQSAA